jgi:hypothetical protein
VGIDNLGQMRIELLAINNASEATPGLPDATCSASAGSKSANQSLKGLEVQASLEHMGTQLSDCWSFIISEARELPGSGSIQAPDQFNG